MTDTPEPPTSASIRPATDADLETILDHRIAMLQAVFAETPGSAEFRELNRTWIVAHLGVDFLVWVAELDGKPAASAAILWFDHPPSSLNPGGREAYILNVYTDPAARRLGLARRLMERLVEEAAAAGVRRVWLRASDDGRPLYESMGFGTSNYLELRLR
jgi:ribosomal protein S18 acetylase RimI-like enzyme